MGRIAFLGLVLLVAACSQRAGQESSSSVPATKEYGSHAFLGGQIYTVNEKQPWAEAQVVKDDKIIYIGDSQGAELLISGSTQVHDLAGS